MTSSYIHILRIRRYFLCQANARNPRDVRLIVPELLAAK